MDPLHITEFASQRYFDKLKKLNENGENAAHPSAATTTTTTHSTSPPELLELHQTFTLPLGNPRQHRADEEISLVLRPSDQKKRSLGHDLSTLRTQRRPTFSGSFGSLRSKVTITHKSPSIAEHHLQILSDGHDGPQQYVESLVSRIWLANILSDSPSPISSLPYPVNFKRTSLPLYLFIPY
jgi:hypothetical protein